MQLRSRCYRNVRILLKCTSLLFLPRSRFRRFDSSWMTLPALLASLHHQTGYTFDDRLLISLLLALKSNSRNLILRLGDEKELLDAQDSLDYPTRVAQELRWVGSLTPSHFQRWNGLCLFTPGSMDDVNGVDGSDYLWIYYTYCQMYCQDVSVEIQSRHARFIYSDQRGRNRRRR